MREYEKREGIPLRENEQQWRGCELQVREHFCIVVGRVEKSLRVDEQREEGTYYGGEQQNREVANWRVRTGFSYHSEVNSGWSVHVGED